VLVFRLGGRPLYRLEASGTLGSEFAEVREVFTDSALLSPFLQILEVCLEPSDARIQVANLVLRQAPEITVPVLTVTGPVTGADPIHFTWISRAGNTYQLQARVSLTGGSWQPVGPSLAGTGEALTVSAPPPATSEEVFYRLVEAP
ncbi:MAG: hypothetical protein KIT22_13110, partial [Verrucomicrobiae bacterium]|nr:hypothetical protein [Verrucomicrobiae bacterium]